MSAPSTGSAASGRSASAPHPNTNVSNALLALFSAAWSVKKHDRALGASQDGPAQHEGTERWSAESEALSFLLRICFTLSILEAKRSRRPQPPGPTLRVEPKETEATGPLQEITEIPEALTLTIEQYALELQLQPQAPAPEPGFRMSALCIYNEYEALASGVYPCYPIVLTVKSAAPTTADDSSSPSESPEKQLVIAPKTKALYFVEQLGEPGKKGGGELMQSGPSAWLEWRIQLQLPDASKSKTCWTEMLLQISLKGEGSRGSDRWEKGRASDCTWDNLFLQLAE